MGKIESVIRSEVVRLARKEIRATCQPVASTVRALKRQVSQLSKAVRALKKLGDSLSQQRAAEKPKLEASPEELKSARFSPQLIKKLRLRLGLTQAELARLIGVSSPSIAFWERGRNRPTDSNKLALVAIRKLGRRQVRRLLGAEEQAKEA